MDTTRKKGILDILYPRHCPVCHEILKDRTSLICRECIDEIHKIQEPRCLKCGKPVREGEEYCRDCLSKPHVYDQGVSVVIYNKVWQQSITRFKSGGCREYADFYGTCMAWMLLEKLPLWKPHRIIPVPLDHARERKRGYNQAWLLARRIGELTGLKADRHVLKKKRHTKEQKSLSAAERAKNLHDSFETLCPLYGERILVVDDVYTTGSTMDEAAACLKKAGAAEVYFVTFCIAIT